MKSSITGVNNLKLNPINLFERIIISKNWAFERPIDDEIFIEIPTKYSNLIVQVTWLKKEERIDIRASFYLKMDFSSNIEIYKLLNLINNIINFGHFQINSNKYPTFKNSISFCDEKKPEFHLIEETLNNAVSESERFFPAFQLVLWAGKKAEEAKSFLDFKTEGIA